MENEPVKIIPGDFKAMDDEDIEFDKEAIIEELNEIKYNSKHRYDQIVEKSDRFVQNLLDGNEVKIGKRSKHYRDAPDEVPQIDHDKKIGGMNDKVIVVYTAGQYYRNEIAWDPTVSEAFDTGFLTALKMIEAGLIEAPKAQA